MTRQYKGNTVVTTKEADRIIDSAERQFNKYKKLYPDGFHIRNYIAHTVDCSDNNSTIKDVMLEVGVGLLPDEYEQNWNEKLLAYIYWYPLSPNRKNPYTVQVKDSDGFSGQVIKTKHFKDVESVVKYVIALAKDNKHDKENQ